ncbi:MAG: Gfo/Idh/MocA family protein [Alphaproteobacteria bacterium]
MEKIRIAMLGGGIGSMIGASHRDALMLSGQYELVAACFSANEERNKETAQNVRFSPRLYTHWQDLITQEAQREDGARAVIIVTPDHLHFEMCRFALEHKIHVICDKPLCENDGQAQILIDLAIKNQKRLEVTYTVSGDPTYRAMKEYISQPDFGAIYQISGKLIADWGRGLPELDSNHKMHKQAWRFKKDVGTGALGDVAVHIFEYCRQLVNDAPISLTGSMQKIYDERELSDGGQILLQYPDNLLMNIRYSLSLTDVNHYQITINGINKAVEYHVFEDDFWVIDENHERHQIKIDAIPNFEPFTEFCEDSHNMTQEQFNGRYRFKNLYDDFAENIRENKLYTPRDVQQHAGLCGIKMTSKMLKAAQNKQWVDW